MSSHCHASAMSFPVRPLQSQCCSVARCQHLQRGFQLPTPLCSIAFSWPSSSCFLLNKLICGSVSCAFGCECVCVCITLGRKLISEFHLTNWPVTCATLYKTKTKKMCHLQSGRFYYLKSVNGNSVTRLLTLVEKSEFVSCCSYFPSFMYWSYKMTVIIQIKIGVQQGKGTAGSLSSA